MHLGKPFTAPFWNMLNNSVPMRCFSAITHCGFIRPQSIAFTKPLQRHLTTATQSLPRTAQPSVWQSIIPKTFRKPREVSDPLKKLLRREWNPATFFIVIFLLVGSNAIQMIVLRNDFITFSRKAEAKIGLLKEVIGRVQKGEDVDVEGLLGTGNEDQEREWEEVIREIEEVDRNWEPNARRKKGRRELKPESDKLAETDAATKADVDNQSTKKILMDAATDGGHRGITDRPQEVTSPKRPRGFY